MIFSETDSQNSNELHAKIHYNSTRLNTTISGDSSCSLFLKTLDNPENF